MIHDSNDGPTAMTDRLGRLLLVALEAARLRRGYPSAPGSPLVARLLARHRFRRARHGAPGLRPPTHALRRARLAGDLLHDRDGALAHERDWHRLGADAVARNPAGGVGGPQEGGLRRL